MPQVLVAYLYIDFSSAEGQQPLSAKLGHFVLGDSQQAKNTKGILARVKDGTLEVIKILSQNNKKLNIKTITLKEL